MEDISFERHQSWALAIRVFLTGIVVVFRTFRNTARNEDYCENVLKSICNFLERF